MIVRDRNIVVTKDVVSGAIAEFMRDVRPRLVRLGKAYEGQGAITKRMRSAGLPNHHLVHAFPRYIVTMASGYLVGKPVNYEVTNEEQREALDVLQRMYTACDMGSVDAELASDASIYGRGVCICYADETGRPRAATLSPKEAFVVYDDTVEHRPIFGVHWFDRYDETGKRSGVYVHAHTAGETYAFAGKTLATLGALPDIQPHYFGGVPMVEFWNNAQETGDFEPVLSLIDAYDMLESDRVNDKQQFTDAVLLLTGCTLENDDPQDPRSPAQRLLEEKTLSLPDTDAKAEWLCKQSDESGAQLRLRLFAHFMEVLAAGLLHADEVIMTFTRSLPVNESEAAQMVAQLDGIVPRRMLLTQLPFVEDAEAAAIEMEAVQKKG